VTEEGLKELKELKNLTRLLLDGTKVTDAGKKELKEALPNCNTDALLPMKLSGPAKK